MTVTCTIPAVVTNNALVYTYLENAMLHEGASLASATNARASEISATNSETAAIAAKVAAIAAKEASFQNSVDSREDRNFAQKWASKAVGLQISDGENADGYSAYHWAMQAKKHYDDMVLLLAAN